MIIHKYDSKPFFKKAKKKVIMRVPRVLPVLAAVTEVIANAT